MESQILYAPPEIDVMRITKNIIYPIQENINVGISPIPYDIHPPMLGNREV